MTLWNDFTHFLNDPVNGDQEQQNETRTTTGGQVAADFRPAASARSTTRLVGRCSCATTAPMSTGCTPMYRAAAGLLFGGAGRRAGAAGADAPAASAPPTRCICWIWVPTSRTPRTGALAAHGPGRARGVLPRQRPQPDHRFQGTTDETLLQPKGSVIFGPFAKTELYFSAGRGFHSDDVRGVFGTVPLEGVPGAAGADAAAGADPGRGVRASAATSSPSCRPSSRCSSRTSIRS